jgi:3-dehydroshikimate dehydratase
MAVLDGSNLVKPRTPADCPGQTANYNFQTNHWEYANKNGTGPNVRGYYGAGLALQDSHDVEISGIEVRNFCIGIASVRSNNVYIHDVRLVDNHGAAGVIFTGDDGKSASTALSFNNRLMNSVLLDNGDGFEFTRGTHDSLLQGNTISLTQPLPVDGNAVEFATSGDNNAVIGNTFTKYVDTAITISGNNHTIRDNNISDNKGSGMRVNGNNHLVFGNTFANNGGSGLSVGGSSSRVQDNIIDGNGAQGIVINGSRISLSRNSIYNNGKLGIDISSGPNAPVLESSSKWTATGINLNGSLTASPQQTYRMEMYASHVPDGGERYLGAASATTDGAGKASFALRLNLTDPLGDGRTSAFITAITIDAAGSTSKFSSSISLTMDK